MEIRQLRYFLSLIEQGAFNRAANASHITQPALSKSMKALEDELGVELLDRSGPQIVPTTYGKILARAAHLADGELKRAIKEINSLAERGGGRLVVGGGVVLRYLLPPTLKRIRQLSHPVEIVVVEELAIALLAALGRGEVDVAICPPAVEDLAHGICQEHLLRDKITVVAHRDHPILRIDKPTLADLSAFGWVMPGGQEKERQVLERSLFSAGLPPPRLAVETSSSAMMAQLLEGEQLLGYLPLIVLERDPALQHLRSVPVPVPWKERELCVFWRDASTTLPAMQQFLQCVREAARSLAAPAGA